MLRLDQENLAVGESVGMECPPSGTEWIVDAVGCDAALLADLSAMRKLCGEVIERLELRVVGQPQWHQFPQPGGVTGLYLLSESHLACHTFPEHGLATLNLYCCRRRTACDWSSLLCEQLRATEVRVRKVTRGLSSSQEDGVR